MDALYPFLKIGMPFEYIAAVTVVLIAGCTYLWRGNRPKEWYIILFLLAYFALILGKTVIYRETGAVEEVNTYPFWSYAEGFTKRRYVLVQNLLNIILFLPIGFLLGAIIKSYRLLIVTLLGAGLSLTIELLQLFFEKGLCEFDDIFHNTVGSILGLLILNGVRKMRICRSKSSISVNEGE